MKNISRRVFIKGMAVAAVATAASTVLTGCKLSEDVKDEVENNTVSSKEFTVGDKTLTVSSLNFVVGDDILAKNEAQAKFKFVSTVKSDVEFKKSDLTSGTDDTYFVKVTAYYDNNEKLPVTPTSSSIYSDTFKAEKEATTVGTLDFSGLNPDDKYSTLNVKFELKKLIAGKDSNYTCKSIDSVVFSYSI